MNFLQKIEKLETRDKISILIWMIAFLILINFTDFSSFKADILQTWTSSTVSTETSAKNNSENIKAEKSPEEISKNISNDSNSIEKEIIKSENKKLKEEIDKTETWTAPVLSENPSENLSKSETWEIENLKNKNSETPTLSENISENPKSETWKILESEIKLETWAIKISENPVLSENTSENSDKTNSWNSLEINNNPEDFLETVDKNSETLKKLEDEKNQKIEVVSDIKKEEVDQEKELKNKEWQNSEENKKPETSKNTEINETDKAISATLQQIDEINVQKKAEELAKQMVQKQEQEKGKKAKEGLPESDFTVSWAETESYNEMVRKKKEQAIKDKYEKQLAEQKKENKDLADRLEMLENKIKNQEVQKTPEEIAAEKQQISEREKAKIEAEKKLKALQAEKAEKLRLANIEKDKKQASLDKFNKDSDWDWLSDHVEKLIETNDKLIDTDWDWYSDKTEVDKFFSPNSEWNLFSDISQKSRNKNTIISATKKWLVFLRAWDKFLWDEEIYRDEAIKIIVSAIYPSEIYREDDFFKWVELYSDVSSSDDYARYLAIAIKHWILSWVIADNFDPYSTFSKAEFIKIVMNAVWKWASNKKIKWIDTEYDNWFTPYFAKAKELWIIKTDTFNRIFPLKNISRIEAIKYALRASKYWN